MGIRKAEVPTIEFGETTIQTIGTYFRNMGISLVGMGWNCQPEKLFQFRGSKAVDICDRNLPMVNRRPRLHLSNAMTSSRISVRQWEVTASRATVWEHFVVDMAWHGYSIATPLIQQTVMIWSWLELIQSSQGGTIWRFRLSHCCNCDVWHSCRFVGLRRYALSSLHLLHQLPLNLWLPPGGVLFQLQK